MKRRKRKGNGVRRLLIVLIILAVIIAGVLIDSNRRLVTTHYDVYSKRLPRAFDGMRVVQLSDLHGAEFGEENEKLLEAVKEAEPDLIAITGDMFDEFSDEDYGPGLVSQLGEIAPVYYVSGNHEWVGNPRTTFALMEDAGADVMRNEYVTLEREGETIVLAGVDDPNGPYDMITKEDFVAKIREETDDYILMLSHRNADFDLWVSLDVDLVLCGHAHGGVVRLPLLGGVFSHREDWGDRHLEGCFTEGNTTMVVSRGVGNVGKLSPRFWNNPEVVVVELHSEKE